MHVSSTMSARATSFDHAPFAERTGARESDNAQANAERQLKEQEAAQKRAEEAQAQAKARSLEPDAVLGVADYGYSGALNGGQVSLILIDSFQRQMEGMAERAESARERDAVKAETASRAQDRAEAEKTANTALAMAAAAILPGAVPQTEAASVGADFLKPDQIQAAVRHYQKQAGVGADTARGRQELLIA